MIAILLLLCIFVYYLPCVNISLVMKVSLVAGYEGEHCSTHHSSFALVHCEEAQQGKQCVIEIAEQSCQQWPF